MASSLFSGETKARWLLHAASVGCLPLLQNMAMMLDYGKGRAETIKAIKNDEGLGALHCAAQEGNAEICRYLIEQLGFSVDLQSEKGGTALFYASGKGRVVTARYLILHGADLTASDEEGATPLHISAEFGHVEVVKLLLSKGVPVDPENGRGTPLSLTAIRGERNAMKILLEHGADVNYITHDMYTPLFWCIMGGLGEYFNCIKLLIKAASMMFKKFDGLMVKGQDAIQKKDFHSALMMYNGAVKIDSKYPMLYAKRSLCYLRLGEADQALTDAYMAQSLRPDWPEAHIRIGEAFMSLENYKGASKAFLEGSILDPANKDIKNALRNTMECKKKSRY